MLAEFYGFEFYRCLPDDHFALIFSPPI